ncbi:ABC-type transport auxiliary lipoprotein family protein [Maridesulfovibrio sp.]|uniref:ABC-type transport auxiliary lipoprotein family protein n=1 Tax=Maridesulfovibrio sp. TaxID=2795000 RepID=UPI0029F540CD|nr:ABC-type transport auxiliary lipoprotein family protein [Maridesulfovibrio sp.]
MIKKIIPVAVLVLLVFTSGCIGGKSVQSSYLRIGEGSYKKGCDEVVFGMPRLALKNFSSLPALDRETLIIAKGQVLKPDFRWSWEGTPAEIFDLIAGPALNCMKSHEVVTPYRPGIDRDLVLSGVITSFELQRSGGDRFRVAVYYSLWDSSGKELLARRLIEAEVPVKSINGAAIAAAAGQAVKEMMQETAAWIDGLEGGDR